jgi:L-ribulokinase
VTVAPCAVGLDFGTASVRAVVVETATGLERGTAVSAYRHGVIDRVLPGSNVALGPDWALQHPSDYLESAADAVTAACRAANVAAAAVVGIGLDFTSCTILPIDASGRPLCLDARFASRPHAWVKLWKHHAAQPEADRLNELAAARGEAFLADYGGRTSSEWLCPKVLQIVDEDPEVYDAASGFVEAGDWVAFELCGTLVRNACAAGYKGLWSRERGFPGAFFAALDRRLDSFVEKLPGEIVPPGRRIGGLRPAMAERFGLRPGTAVAAPIIDAHSAVPGCTVVTPGRMVMVLGTSTCHMLLADRHARVEGVAGVVADGIVEGWYGYEAGQAAVGDLFGWCAREWTDGAGRAEEVRFAELERAATDAGVGARGVLALDWWNGNRSVLANADLSGLLVGLTLSTTKGDVYRSLIEATGFGTRRILESFAREAIGVGELVAVGGLALRSPLLLQAYADITRLPIRLAASANASATGAAMLGALAAGGRAGGHDKLLAAAECMARLLDRSVEPRAAASDAYDELYAHYVTLHDYFGRGNPLMARLRRMRQPA